MIKVMYINDDHYQVYDDNTNHYIGTIQKDSLHGWGLSSCGYFVFITEDELKEFYEKIYSLNRGISHD